MLRPPVGIEDVGQLEEHYSVGYLVLQCTRLFISSQFVDHDSVCHVFLVAKRCIYASAQKALNMDESIEMSVQQSAAAQQSLPRRRLDMEMAAQRPTESPEPLSSVQGRSWAALETPSPGPAAAASPAMMRARAALVAEEEDVRCILPASLLCLQSSECAHRREKTPERERAH